MMDKFMESIENSIREVNSVSIIIYVNDICVMAEAVILTNYDVNEDIIELIDLNGNMVRCPNVEPKYYDDGCSDTFYSFDKDNLHVEIFF